MPVDDKTGKRYSRKTGKPIGRPLICYPEGWDDTYQLWREGKITATKAMTLLQLKKNTFYKLAKSYSGAK